MVKKSRVIMSIAAVVGMTVCTAASASAATAAPAQHAQPRLMSGHSTAFAPPFTWNWGAPANCAYIFGSPGWRQGYSWRVASNIGGPWAVQVWGMDQNGHGRWIDAGAYGPGNPTGRASVNWGNVADEAKMRVQGNQFSNGGAIDFSC